MKIKISYLFTILWLGVMMTACHDDVATDHSDDSETGLVNLRSLAVDLDNAETVIANTVERRARALVDMSGYQVTILQGEQRVAAWTYGDMPVDVKLPVGNYTARVVSGTAAKAAWDNPVFVGEKAFTVTTGDTVNVGIVNCALANIKVGVIFDESLRKVMGEDARVTVTSGDDGKLDFLPTETRAGYFAALEGSSTMIAEFNGKISGQETSFRTALTDVQPGQYRIITFKTKRANPDGTGYININGEMFTIDATVETVDLTAQITVTEDNLPDDRPTFGGNEPDPGQPITITSSTLSFDHPNSIDVPEAIVNIVATRGIAHFVVKIRTDNEEFGQALEELLPTEFDLAYPGDYEEIFQELGFPTGSQVIDATEVTFDISLFVPLLGSFPGTHSFTLSVTDNAGYALTKTLVFVAP